MVKTVVIEEYEQFCCIPQQKQPKIIQNYFVFFGASI